jgi:hypothetical protein
VVIVGRCRQWGFGVISITVTNAKSVQNWANVFVLKITEILHLVAYEELLCVDIIYS